MSVSSVILEKNKKKQVDGAERVHLTCFAITNACAHGHTCTGSWFVKRSIDRVCPTEKEVVFRETVIRIVQREIESNSFVWAGQFNFAPLNRMI